ARDLETIIIKSIEKDPKRRYQSANEMAEDLRHFLDDEPILARRPTSVERYARWARRNPGVAILGGVLTAVLLLVTAGSLIVAGRMSALASAMRRAADNERASKLDAQVAQRHAVRERNSAEKSNASALAALKEADTERRRAEENFQNALNAVDQYFTQ